MTTVLLPTYNQAKFLPDALAGLEAQTRRDFEVIACDDASTDDTSEILRARGVRSVRHQDNCGTASAINCAATLGSPGAAYITWVSSDNVMLPRWLDVLAGELDAHPEYGAVYSAFNWCDGDRRPLRPGAYDPAQLIGSEQCYFGPSFLIRSEVWQVHRGQSSHDYDNWLRVEEECWRRGLTIGYVDEPLCDYRVGGWQTVRQYPDRYDAARWRQEAIERRAKCTTPATTAAT
jgi:glycosyltransferase involved in cell wall biosynthesis